MLDPYDVDQELSHLIEVTPNGMFVTDVEGRLVLVNQEFERTFGYERSELLGQPVEMLLPENLRAAHVHKREAYLNDLTTRRMGQGRELRARCKDGTEIEVEIGLSFVMFRDRQAIAGSIANVTERKRAERALAKLAFEDALTGLPSRAGFLDRLEQRLQDGGVELERGYLLALNLRNVSDINEAYGYEGGDHLIRSVAARLAGGLRDGEFVARLEGDKFGLFLLRAPRGLDHADEAVDWVRRYFDEPFLVQGEFVHVEAHLGAAGVGSGEETSTALLRRAELALHAARKQPGIHWATHSSELQRMAQHRLKIAQGLRFGLNHDEFELYYQPKIALQGGRLDAAEALLRWRRGDEGLVPPGEFIPIAESSQLIIPIGQQVLRRGCMVIREWQEDPTLPELGLGVNVSIVQLAHSDFAATVRAAVEEAGIDPGSLTLEITETAFERDAGRLLEQMRALHGVGVRLALDDFGTGYSSLAYLAQYPFDELKIDKQFVQQCATHSYSREIVRMVVRIARILGCEATAEGIETEDDRERMIELGCRVGQGFYFGRPAPIDALRTFLAQAGE